MDYGSTRKYIFSSVLYCNTVPPDMLYVRLTS